MPCECRRRSAGSGSQAIEQAWGKSILRSTQSPLHRRTDLHGRLADCSRGGSSRDGHLVPFVHPHGAAGGALMHDGGALSTMTYYGGEKLSNITSHGPIKAALESACATSPTSLGQRESASMPSPQGR